MRLTAISVITKFRISNSTVYRDIRKKILSYRGIVKQIIFMLFQSRNPNNGYLMSAHLSTYVDVFLVQ